MACRVVACREPDRGSLTEQAVFWEEPAWSPVWGVIVFDVNETLSDMAPVGGRFADVGVPGLLAAVWFYCPASGQVRAGGLRRQGTIRPARPRCAGGGAGRSQPEPPVAKAADHVLAGFSDLGVHPDVPDEVRLLCESGLRPITLSNGSTDVADRLLTKAGIPGEFEISPVSCALSGSRAQMAISIGPGTATVRSRR